MASSDLQPRGRVSGLLHQSKDRFLNKGLGRGNGKVAWAMCSPFIDTHTHTHCVDFFCLPAYFGKRDSSTCLDLNVKIKINVA